MEYKAADLTEAESIMVVARGSKYKNSGQTDVNQRKRLWSDRKNKF